MSKKNMRPKRGYVSQNKSKEAKTLHYQKEIAKAQAKRDAINAGKSQASADRAGARAEKGVTGNKVSNLQEKRELNAAVRKETTKKAPQKLSFWERAKNKAKGLYNGAKTAYKNTKTKVSKALDKTWAGRQVKKVARPFVKGGEWIAKKSVQIAKRGYDKGKKGWNASKALGRKVAKASMKIGGKIAGKTGVKTAKFLVKKVPVVSAVAGVCFAGYEAIHGNWGRAAAELASGAVACVPGWGTAASVAIDAAVIGYDIHEANQQKAAKDQQFAKKQPHQQARQQQAQQQNTNTNTIETDSKTQTKTENEVQNQSSVRDAHQTMHRDQQHRFNANITEVQPQTNTQTDNQQTEQQVQREQERQDYEQQSQSQQMQGEQQHNYEQLQQTQREQYGLSGASRVSVANKGEEIVVSYGQGQEYTISKDDLKARMGMSSKRAKGTMAKLQGAVAANSNTEGVIDAVSNYVPELKKDGKGTAKVNRNLVDSTVKAIGGSSKATSITIDGKKIKAKDIQKSYGCTKKEAKQILKAYGRAIEDGANLDDVLRDIASGKKLDTNNQMPAKNNVAMRAMMAQKTMHDFS